MSTSGVKNKDQKKLCEELKVEVYALRSRKVSTAWIKGIKLPRRL